MGTIFYSTTVQIKPRFKSAHDFEELTWSLLMNQGSHHHHPHSYDLWLCRWEGLEWVCYHTSGCLSPHVVLTQTVPSNGNIRHHVFSGTTLRRDSAFLLCMDLGYA